MPADRKDASAAPTEGMILPDADSGPTLGTQPPPAELSGQVGELAAELGVGWTRESYPPPRMALEAVRQSPPRQESPTRTEPRCAAAERQRKSAGRRRLTRWARSIYCA